VTAAVGKESEGSAPGEGASEKAEPGHYAHPADFAFDGGEENQSESQDAGQRDGGAESPAHARDPADEEIGKPDGDGQRAHGHENAEGQEIAGNRQMPGTFAEKTLERDDRERNNQISDKEKNGALSGLGIRLLEQRQYGKQDDDGARVDDLPLEMAPIRFVGAHARGMQFLWNSLTRRGEGEWRRIQLATVGERLGRGQGANVNIFDDLGYSRRCQMGEKVQNDRKALAVVIYLKDGCLPGVESLLLDFNRRWKETLLVEEGQKGNCLYFRSGDFHSAIELRNVSVPPSVTEAVLNHTQHRRRTEKLLRIHNTHFGVVASLESCMTQFQAPEIFLAGQGGISQEIAEYFFELAYYVLTTDRDILEGETIDGPRGALRIEFVKAGESGKRGLFLVPVRPN
jgi:hypothetical protein